MALRISAYKGTDPTSDKRLLVDALVLPIFNQRSCRPRRRIEGWVGREHPAGGGGASSSTPADEDSARELEREMTGFRSVDRQRGGGGGDALTKAFLEGVQKPSL